MVSLSLKCLPFIITFSWTPSSRESKSGCCGNAEWVLELGIAVAGTGSWVVDDDGVQEGVDRVGMGVREEGSQAGVEEGGQSGMGVALPELEAT